MTEKEFDHCVSETRKYNEDLADAVEKLKDYFVEKEIQYFSGADTTSNIGIPYCAPIRTIS